MTSGLSVLATAGWPSLELRLVGSCKSTLSWRVLDYGAIYFVEMKRRSLAGQ